ncbi:hypothetical protein AO071_16295 [Pseudomonas syringae]|nr:hypothetical protein AO071_16295 [Pseudomonas syringae]
MTQSAHTPMGSKTIRLSHAPITRQKKPRNPKAIPTGMQIKPCTDHQAEEAKKSEGNSYWDADSPILNTNDQSMKPSQPASFGHVHDPFFG